jgi:hypothetical protein
MLDLLGILLLLIFPAMPEPTTYAPPHHGIFPFYGYEEVWGENIAPTIANLIRTGAYKIEELEIARRKTIIDTSISYYDIEVYGDTISIIEFRPKPNSGKYLRRDTEIYLTNGKQIFPNLDEKDLQDKIGKKYDIKGRIIEEDEFDRYQKITRKTVYEYDSLQNVNIKSEYELIEPERPKFPKLPRVKDSTSKARRDSADSAYHRAYAQWEQQYKTMGDEYRLWSEVVTRIDSIKRTEEIYDYNFEKGDSLPLAHYFLYYDSRHRQIKEEDLDRNGKIKLVEETEYKDDPYGRLLSKTVYRNGDTTYKDKWTYDHKGRCILHSDLNYIYEWKYDSKGNMIEYLESWHGVPGFKNTFKIFYK